MDLRTTSMIAAAAFALITKLADVWTTDRYVGIQGEMNPLARRVFEALGLRKGMAAICVLIVIDVAALGYATWASESALGAVLFTAYCVGAGFAHLDVARFNATGTPSWFTHQVARAYGAWSRAWARTSS